MKNSTWSRHRPTLRVGLAVALALTASGGLRSTGLVATAQAQVMRAAAVHRPAPPLLSPSDVQGSLGPQLQRMRDRRMTRQMLRSGDLQRLRDTGRAPSVHQPPPPRVPPPPAHPDSLE